MSFIDARNFPDGSAIDADLVIVGAGMAGIALAREWAGADLTVAENVFLGSQPVDRMLIVCDVYGVGVKTIVGRLVANIQEPLPAGSTRTFTNVSLNGSAVASEQTVECRRVISALRS